MGSYSGTITASADDAAQNVANMNLTGSNITINDATKWAGLLFKNVTIAQGDTITTAPLTVEIGSLSFDDPDVDIWAEDVDNAATFTTTNNDITNRTPTTAVVQWTASSVGTGSVVGPDLAAVIQEIVSRPGWVSGNAIAIILAGRSTNPLRFNAYDNGSGVFATLNITSVTGGNLTKQAMYYAAMRR